MNKILSGVFYLSLSLLVAGCGSPIDDQQHVENARQFLNSGDQKSALIELKSALQQNPDNSEARSYLGQLYLQAGNFGAAEKELKKAKQLGADDNDVLPSLSQAQLQLREIDEVLAIDTSQLDPLALGQVLAAKGIAHLTRGESSEAAELTEKALSMAANSPYVRVARASAYLRGEDAVEKARAELEKAFEIDNNYPAAWSLLGDLEVKEKHLEEAREAYTKSISLQPTNLSDRNKRVTVNILLNDLKKAQYDLDILKKKLPGNPGVAFSQGLVYLVSQKLEDAKSAFDLALLDQERYPLSLFYLAYVNYQQGNMAQAETHAERYFTINPDYLPNRKLLAEIKYAKNQYDNVERLLTPVLKDNEKDEGILNILAKTQLMQGKTAEGIALLNNLVEQYPDSVDARIRLGAGLLLSGSEEDGFKELDVAIKQDDSNHRADIFRVLSYLRLKQIDNAHQAVSEFQSRAPDSEIPYNLSGMIYLAERDYKAAREALEQSWKMKPGNTDAGHNLAAILIMDRDYNGARNYLDEVLAAHPDNLETLVKLAELDALEGKTEQQVRKLEKAIRLYPSAVKPRTMLANHFIQIGKPGQVAGLIETLDLETKRQVPVMTVIANQKLAQGDFESAEREALKIIERDPDGANGYFLLAQARMGLGQTDQAETALLEALEKDEQFLSARIALLRLLARKQDIPAIEHQLAILKTTAADNEEVIRVEFALEELKGDHQQALVLAERLFKAYPTTENMLALSRQRLRVGDSDGALSLQETWADKNSDNFTANLILAETYTQLGKYDLSARYYKKALELSPDNVLVLNNLAWSLREGDPEQALVYAEKANELKPGTVTLMDTLAMVYLANKNPDKALQTIKEARYLDPENRTLRLHEAKINAAAGNKELAVETLQELLSKEEEFAEKSEAEALLKSLKNG